ncbi:MAG: hypothetical protein ACOH2K_04950 [Burkholderiaceae bacterium]
MFPSKGASLELNFETEEDAKRARQALWISKFYPAVFRAFPEFRQYDPTLGLPKEVREKAVRIFPKNGFQWDEEDVIGVVSSLYKDDGTLVGSLVNVAWQSPLLHAFMLYELLTAPALGFGIDYKSAEQKVFVSILKRGVARDLGFWIDCPQNQIQTFDLQASLGGKGYLGVGLPLLSRIHEQFTADTIGNQRQEYSDDFFDKQIVNDWLIFHLRGEKVHRQSFTLQGKSMLSPAKGLQLERNLSTAQWMSTASSG